MSRLTIKTVGCFEYDLQNYQHKIGEFNDYDAFFAYNVAVKKLGEYEELEEQGRLIKLPCKVGEIVWTNKSIQGWYLRKTDRPYAIKVVFIGLNDSVDMGYGFINAEYKTGYQWQFDFNDIGKTVFLTIAEAEAKLRELRERDGE